MKKQILQFIIKTILLFGLSYLSFKYTQNFYILALIAFSLILLFFFRYQEIFIISIALLISCIVIYFFNVPMYYEKAGEFLFFTLIAGFFKIFYELRKEPKDKEA